MQVSSSTTSGRLGPIERISHRPRLFLIDEDNNDDYGRVLSLSIIIIIIARTNANRTQLYIE